MNHEQRYLWLDLIRGISALLVCSSHLRNATMVDFQQIQGQITIFQKIFYFVTGLGHQAVMVFFLLSGFFVGGSVIKAGSNFRVDKYIVARLTRLWVVLLPALIITKFTDTLLEIYEPTVLEGVFRQLWNSGPNPGEYSSGLITFISNMFFLQAIESPVFGTNGPLWSLAYEFWFYVLFPLCMILLGKAYQNHAKKIYFKILSLTLIIDIYFFLPTEIKSGFLVWLLGAGVFVTIGNNILKKQLLVQAIIIIGWLGFLFSLVYSKQNSLIDALGLPSDQFISICFSILLVGLVNIKKSEYTIYFAFISRWLSEFSYSLYIIHFPFVVLIGGFFYKTEKIQPNTSGVLQFFGWFFLLIIISFMFYWLFERNTNKIRKAISGYLRIN